MVNFACILKLAIACISTHFLSKLKVIRKPHCSNASEISGGKGLSTREAGRGHATPHMPVETAKCWWLLKIEPNAWAGGKGSCAVCVDLQAVGALEFFGELYSLAKGFGPFLREALEKGRVLFLVTTSTLPSLQAYAELELHASRVDKPLVEGMGKDGGGKQVG